MNRITSFLIAAIIVMAFIITHLFGKVGKLSEEKAQLIEVADKNKRAAETYINLHGAEVSKNETLQLSLDNAQELNKRNELGNLKQFQGLRKNIKNLEAVVQIKNTIIQDLRLKNYDSVIVILADTIPVKKFSYSDEFNSIKGIVKDDTSELVVNVKVPIEGVVYWERKKKFWFIRYGKKTYYSEFTSRNPWVTIENHETTIIKK